jgi:Flp pilus assembly protein TadD
VGRVDSAERKLNEALQLFPKYHYALANMAKVRIAQKRYDDAVVLLQQRYDAAPHAENLFDLAQAVKLAGRGSEARSMFAEFERKSLLETNKTDNSNHELVYYYADVAKEPGKALEVAQREIARRHDVFTLDAHAWALDANGRHDEARKEIEQSMKVGIRDARILRHAAEIASQCGDKVSAAKYLSEATELDTPKQDQAKIGPQGLDRLAVAR